MGKGKKSYSVSIGVENRDYLESLRRKAQRKKVPSAKQIIELMVEFTKKNEKAFLKEIGE